MPFSKYSLRIGVLLALVLGCVVLLPTRSSIQWQGYSDIELGLHFEYPTTWKIISYPAGQWSEDARATVELQRFEHVGDFHDGIIVVHWPDLDTFTCNNDYAMLPEAVTTSLSTFFQVTTVTAGPQISFIAKHHGGIYQIIFLEQQKLGSLEKHFLSSVTFLP